MKDILYLKKSKMAGKKYYLCAYEKARYNINNVYSTNNGCTEYHVGAKQNAPGKQGRKAG